MINDSNQNDGMAYVQGPESRKQLQHGKKNSIEEKGDKLFMKKLMTSRKEEQKNSVKYHHSRRELFINLESQTLYKVKL